MSATTILHLVGSAESDFYANLSRLYAKDSLEALNNNPRYNFRIAYITPNRLWRFPSSLSQVDIDSAQPLSIASAVEFLHQQKIDLVLPQMFCLPGMTEYRSLLDLLQIRYIGNPPDVMAIAANKAKTKAIVATAGVKVPKGELLRHSDIPSLKPPVVIKPVNADNSLGVTLVKEKSEYQTALQTAFSYSSEVLVEEYIALGREVRCGIIVKDGELLALPLEEYLVNADNQPIRNYADKLKQTDNGELIFAAKDNGKAWIVDTTDSITPSVQSVAKQCHQALGCRHYSLFDFRIDPLGQPWFLEAGLYCSFSPKSVIVTMAKAAGISLDDLLMNYVLS
ncbi:ATP-grasp enzyme, D-alanine-D-alanine ligase [Gloeocapsa sp. PCC 73106]|uniref:D-alanine--D-alanine ligase family protein n=1 Tax=Gloeocapsa sp. PCC 73106 TaxID=102232 RepID=UPI0002AC545D|nr:ATP-grasp enzyme, D-alanine-D-alanine ligase [Gloeocapsa sp. PCC 73106]ELR99434.1 ATP-grasp enzyme, D-alanine-D-alanine ligase [Gloeocapsa sp. PCC 73106]